MLSDEFCECGSRSRTHSVSWRATAFEPSLPQAYSMKRQNFVFFALGA